MTAMKRSRNLVMICGLIMLIDQAQPWAAEPDADLVLIRQTVTNRTMLRRGSYNYAPAVILDGSRFHLYWCADGGKDVILHAEAAALEGPWHATADRADGGYDVALAPTRSPDDFDGLHTCDPNVLRLGDRFFMYYGGQATEGGLTAVGVAESRDGVHFTRMNDGRPIVTAARTNPAYAARTLTYGTGQPAAVYVAPYVYLAVTDSTGSGANPGNGAGQFALRSTDPAFRTGVEELTASGWAARRFGEHTAEHAFLESFGLDWMYDERTHTILAVTHRVPGEASLLALEPWTLRVLTSGRLALDWREGPALLARSDKSTPPRDACDRATLDVLAAAGASWQPRSWNSLAFSEAEYSLTGLCATRAR